MQKALKILLTILLLSPTFGAAQTISVSDGTATGTFSTDQPTGVITAEDDANTDAAIAQRLRDILGELGGFEDVTVQVSSGIVTMRGTTLSSADTARLDGIAARIEGVVAVENLTVETADVVRRLDPVRDRLRARIEQFILLIPMLAIAAVAFAFVVTLGFFLARRKVLRRLSPNAFIADVYRMIVRLVFVVLGIVLALDILNATALLSTILGAAGIIGLAVGFAVRDTVENFIASIMLSIRQPFRPNDAVEINGDTGLVIRLTSRATILLSFDGNHIRIPNATVFKSRIVNFSSNPERRFMFEIGIAPNADLAAMRHLAEDTVASMPFTLSDPAPSAWTERIGDGAVILTVAGWIDQRETNLVLARGEAIRKVKAAIEAAGVDVPDTSYRVELIGGAGIPPSVGTAAPFTPQQIKSRKAAQSQALTDDDISTPHNDALDRIVTAEQADSDKPNLLREGAPEE